MAKLYATSLTALVLLAGSGLPPLADAQQTYAVPPAYDASSQPPEPPPAYGAQPRYREYPQPAPTQDAPPPVEYGEAGWLPPGGSVQVQTEGNVRYASGGIGLSEREELGALSGQFNLRLMFAMHGSGNYLADVRIRILDPRGGAVLDATSRGPYFLVQLPSGRYTVEAEMLGQIQRQTTLIGARQSQLNFYWR